MEVGPLGVAAAAGGKRGAPVRGFDGLDDSSNTISLHIEAANRREDRARRSPNPLPSAE